MSKTLDRTFLAIVLALSLGLIWASKDPAHAEGRADDYVQRVYVNDGNTTSGFRVNCSSTAWTEVIAARGARRRAFIQLIPNAVTPVCLATHTVSGIVCDDAFVGVELSTAASGVGTNALNHYGESALNCRLRTHAVEVGSTDTLKGFDYFDSKD